MTEVIGTDFDAAIAASRSGMFNGDPVDFLAGLLYF
jgi:hypothetical protein